MKVQFAREIQGIYDDCRTEGWDSTWNSIGVIIMITGVIANIVLLWLFLKERKSLSPSQVLGMNLVVMDLIYLSAMPISWINNLVQNPVINGTTAKQQNINTCPNERAEEIFSMFNLIGCPLLLACMCTERYLAVIKPVLYMKMRKWEHRMAVSAVVWVITLSFCLAAGLVDDLTTMMLPVSIVISCLFFVMLACLGGVVWSLSQQSPAHSTYGNQARLASPQKRQAVYNVLVVVVPAVMSYLPALALVPLVLYVCILGISLNQEMCLTFEICILCPRLGTLIGPFFYLSKARQLCCLSRSEKTHNK